MSRAPFQSLITSRISANSHSAHLLCSSVCQLPDVNSSNLARQTTLKLNVLRSCRLSSETTSPAGTRSEEHTSELQSHSDLVCRLLLEKKKKNKQQAADEKKDE